MQIIILGLLVGLISSVMGLGGGVLIVPLLPLVEAMSQKEVVATSLATILLVVSLNTYAFNKKDLVKWPIVFWVGPFAALTSYVAGRVAVHLPDSTLKLILGGIIFVFALRILLTPAKKKSQQEGATAKPEKQNKLLFGGLGIAAGAASGMSGVGSGILMSPTLLHFRLVKPNEVSPTSNGIMVFTTLFGALAFAKGGSVEDLEAYRWGLVHLDIVLMLFASAFFAAHFGRKNQQKVPPEWRRWILGILLAAFAIKEVVSAVQML